MYDPSREDYINCLNLLQWEWEANNLRRVRELLQRTKESRYRGFERDYWNRQAHRERATQKLPEDSFGVCYMPDGKCLLIRQGGKLGLWELAGQRLLRTFSNNGEGDKAALSCEGRFVATNHRDHVVRLWDTQSGALVRELKRTPKPRNSPDERALVFSADSALLLALGSEGLVVWQLPSGEPLAPPYAVEGDFYSLAVAPNNAQFALLKSGLLQLYELATYRPLAALETGLDYGGAVTYSPDSRRIAVGFHDSTVRLWDVTTKKALATLSGHKGAITALAFFPEGRYLLSTSEDATLRVWDTETQRCVEVFKGHLGPVTSVSIAPQGHSFVSVGPDAELKHWEFSPPQESRHPLPPYVSRAQPLSFSQDETRVACPDREYARATKRQRFGIWELRPDHRETSHLVTLLENSEKDPCLALAFSPDGRWLLAGHAEGHLTLWDAHSGKELRRFLGHTKPVRQLAFYPDGKRFITASDDTTARIWDFATGRMLHTLAGHQASAHFVGFHLGARRLVTSDEKLVSRIWDGQSGKLLLKQDVPYRPKGPFFNPFYMTFAPDGRSIVTYQPRGELWDAQTGKHLKSLVPDARFGYVVPNFSGNEQGCATFSPDGKRLAIFVGSRRTIFLWDTVALRDLLWLPVHLRGDVETMEFSSDGKRLIARNYFREEQVWES